MAKQDILASVASFGAEQAKVDALVSSDNPPKLQAAALMASAAEGREINMADLPEITKAYFGGNLPKSAPQQQAKFGTFIKAGMAGYGTQTMDKVREVIRGTNDPKAQAKAKSGIFEKMVNAMRKALEVGAVPDDQVIRDVVFGADKEAKDQELEALKRARKALEDANNVSSANMAAQIAAIDGLINRREAEIANPAGDEPEMPRLPAPQVGTKEGTIKDETPAPAPAPVNVEDLADHLLSA